MGDAGRRALAAGWTVALGLGVLAPALPHAAESWIGLTSLRRVAVEVVVDPAHAQVSREELEGRVSAALRDGAPGLHIDPGAPDVLRASVSVRRVSSTELRGFYLPFSGTYGFGVVRLALDRRMTAPGLATPIPAIVWQRELIARASWGQSGGEVRAHLEALLGAFIDDYRRAAGP